MNATHSLADALIVLALAGAFVAWLVLRHRERGRRLDLMHRERLAAMERGLPMPEWPTDPPKAPADPRLMLVHAVAWMAFGLGGMAALGMMGLRVNGVLAWPLPLPLFLLGAGLALFYVLARPR